MVARRPIGVERETLDQKRVVDPEHVDAVAQPLIEALTVADD